MSNSCGVRGPHNILSLVLGFIGHNAFVTPLLSGQYQDKNVVCLQASLKQLKLTPRHGNTLFLTPPLCCGGHHCRILGKKGYFS